MTKEELKLRTKKFAVETLNCKKEELNKLMKEADELVSIFSSSIRTIKSKNPNS